MFSNINGITIFIPLYNGVEFLEESLVSVVNQTYTKWQLIIGINGHNDDIEFKYNIDDIVKKYNDNNKYDIFVKNYNTVGKSNTLNEMVKDAKYEYIAILDVDDYWELNKLELQIPFLEDYDVVGGRCKYFGTKEGSPNIPLGDITLTHSIFSYNPIINSSVIIKKEHACWDDENYVKACRLEDYSLWLKLYWKRCKFYNIDEILCHHRIHKASAFNNKNNENLNELLYLWYEFYQKNVFNTHSS